ncbi:MAG: thermonuclease family protein [Rhodospirillales bacterium]|nr:MAG: thermonuclease family protein [Rhodospirillales bacterium]
MLKTILLAVALVGVLAKPATSDVLVGVATVIDGDTLELHGTRIRLHGIDAPESAQLCIDTRGEPWRCGQRAALALSERIGRASVTCRHTDTDRYERMIAVCYKQGEDLNGWMVAAGWAVAYRRYSHDYVGLEDDARAAKRGIWSSRFVMPWDWRRGERIQPRPVQHGPAPGCDIKGNINARGERIYHVPGGRWYDQTRIDPSQGQRWFCSEKEAKAAGWRRSRQ